jgi:hypothetical protein
MTSGVFCFGGGEAGFAAEGALDRGQLGDAVEQAVAVDRLDEG